MPLSRRYTPEHAPGEKCTYGFDFSFLVPPGVGLAGGQLAIYTNAADPQPANEFTVGQVGVHDRALYASVAGGTRGTDYQLRWTATDTDGNVWPRTGLVLCSDTS